MSRPQFKRKTHRAREALLAIGQQHPAAWDIADRLRRDSMRDGMSWPAWCYLPMGGWYAVATSLLRVPVLAQLDHMQLMQKLAALGTWRMTQCIYRVDPTLYDDLINTPVAGDLPIDVLLRLPEWCIYIELPGLQPGLYGSWVHLEHDYNTGRAELRMWLDADHPYAMCLHIGQWSIEEALQRMLAEAAKNAPAALGGVPVDMVALCGKVVSLLLYICSAGDFTRRGVPGTPENPHPKKTRRDGWKLFPASGPVEWDVGVRMGSALRAAYHAAETGQAGHHTSPRGHVRRAHWHTFVSGPRKDAEGKDIPADKRKRDVRWMPPIPVNLPDVDRMPATIRSIK
ncbi:MAG: hypothetical protein RBR77_04215 [Thauera sp.]|nr:hypothetical protein [Thauera sp.]